MSIERPRAHVTDSLGEDQIRRIFHSRGWAVSKIESDYGIDFDVQIFEGQKANGEWLKVQLKNSESTQYSADDGFISESLETRHAAHYSVEMYDPILLIHADVKAGRTFWYAPQLSSPVRADDERATISVRIPTANELPGSLDNLLEALRQIRVTLGERTIAESPLTNAEQLVSQAQISRLFEEKTLESLTGVWHGRRTDSVLETNLQFLRGTRYEDGWASRGELLFLGRARVRQENWDYPPSWIRLPPNEQLKAQQAERPVNATELDIYASMSVSVGHTDNPPAVRVEVFKTIDQQFWQALRQFFPRSRENRMEGTLRDVPR